MNRYYCYYVNQAEYEEIRKGVRRMNISSKIPHIFIEPIEYYNAESFRALIGRIDSNQKLIHHNQDNIDSYSYYSDFSRGQGNAGVFTFDGVTFYKILNYSFTLSNWVEVNLLRIRETYGYRPNKAFMLMPFKDTMLKGFYEENIKNFLKTKINIDVLRANDFCDNDVIIDTIYSEIENAEIIIAEISEFNKNVFYELGYAAAKQKDIIMILQSGRESSFFDRSHIRWIEYMHNYPESFKKQLAETIKSIRNKRGII